MVSIEVDFDVYKALTGKRATEATTYNDVIRDLLKLGANAKDTPSSKVVAVVPTSASGLIYKGVEFPEGTLFRATYKGQTYTGQIRGGVWINGDGKRQNSPSEAAYSITRNHVNGWRFWECRRPSDTRWRSIDDLRPRK
ncbi:MULTISPECIES: hypothetical protein [unclassified Mesorhizobium]|uniref:hypothetical protein n=1 Tax=unclassified Mesorhizobium TaxID=325217 RepID=UPI00333D9F61